MSVIGTVAVSAAAGALTYGAVRLHAGQSPFSTEGHIDHAGESAGLVFLPVAAGIFGGAVGAVVGSFGSPASGVTSLRLGLQVAAVAAAAAAGLALGSDLAYDGSHDPRYFPVAR